jgi:MFS family permease
MGSISMVAIITAAQFLMRDPGQKGLMPYGEQETIPEEKLAHSGGFSVNEAIRNRHFWILCTVFFSWLFCLSVVAVHIVIYALGLGMSPASAASILAIIGIAGIAGRIGFGRLSDVVGIKPALVISFVMMSVAFLFLLLAIGTWMVLLFAVIFGIAYGTFELLQSPIVADLFGLKSLGTIAGVVLAIGLVGLALGPVAAGLIFDASGTYLAAFIICAVLGIIGALFSMFLPLTGGKKKVEIRLRGQTGRYFAE